MATRRDWGQAAILPFHSPYPFSPQFHQKRVSKELFIVAKQHLRINIRIQIILYSSRRVNRFSVKISARIYLVVISPVFLEQRASHSRKIAVFMEQRIYKGG